MAGNEKKADISMTGNKSGKPSIDGKTLKRLMSYIVGRHKLTFFMVVVCILISSCTVVVSSLFLQILIDNYITPMLSEVNPSFAPLLKTIIMLGCLYLVGVLSTFAYNKMMIKISQGTLKAIRDDMFTHMQTLPIRYFDTHTHGDVMSHYTNDTDTVHIAGSSTVHLSSCDNSSCYCVYDCQQYTAYNTCISSNLYYADCIQKDRWGKCKVFYKTADNNR